MFSLKENAMKRLSCPGIYLMVILTVLALLITGCTASKTNYSGWLKDYNGFAQDPEYKDAMAYSQGDVALKKYTKFIIEPVIVYISPDIKEDTGKIDPEVVHKTTTYLRNALVKVIEENFEVVDKPGQDVAQKGSHGTAVKNPEELKEENVYPILDFWAQKVKKNLTRIHGS
jgi:hypothetical protein